MGEIYSSVLQHEERAIVIFTNKFTTCTLNDKEISSRTDDEFLKKKIYRCHR